MNATATMMNGTALGVWLGRTRVRLAETGQEEGGLKTEWVAARVLGLPRLELPLHTRKILNPMEQEGMEGMVLRLEAGEPLAYVLGDTEFLDLRIKTDARALIPRPETELMVHLVMDDLKKNPVVTPRIVDVGTGSGCIAISLAIRFPGASLMALDRCQDALDLALENAQFHGVENQIEFVCSNTLLAGYRERFDIIVSNPPYIPTHECEVLSPTVKDYEPRIALDGGVDGLVLINRLIDQASSALKPRGKIFLEIGCHQADPVKDRLRTAGFREPSVRKDIAGRERIVRAVR